MINYSDKLAVIGAGPVGLAVARALRQARIPYEQLEARDDLGGNWYQGVYESAHIISSKKTTEYADFPMPEDYPDFPSAMQMLAYLNSYADTFGLRSGIQFRITVLMAKPLPDERWELELAGGEKRIYKGLIVCNGHHWDKRYPNYPGKFTGAYLHSKDYQRPEQLAGKRVLVIGGGNSACDVASEAARVGRECHISLRRGYWFLPKTIFGVPIPELVPGWMPVFAQRIMLRVFLRVVFGKYEKYGLPKPDHKIFEHHPTINSELLHYVKHGRIRPRPDIESFMGQRVFFVDGSSDEFDMVVCATGFHLSFPFLPQGMVPVEGSNALLYGGSTLPDYKNLYIVGTAQVRYGFGPLMTPAATLLCRLIKLQDQMKLPVGLVLKESGARTPQTHLLDPHKALRQMWLAQYTLPLLLRKERRLREKLKPQAQVVAAEDWSSKSKPDGQIF
jgi:hypothetical protein